MNKVKTVVTTVARPSDNGRERTSELWLSINDLPPRMIYFFPTDLGDREIAQIANILPRILTKAIITGSNEVGVLGFIYFDGSSLKVDASNVISAYSGLAMQLVSQMLKRPL